VIGVDIEEVKRFRRLVRNPSFLNRIYTKDEMAYCRSKKNSSQHFAVRFAAKEAIWKALSEIIARLKINVSHRDLGIKNTPKGKPEVKLPRALKKYSRKVSVSLSHTNDYVVAVAFVKL